MVQAVRSGWRALARRWGWPVALIAGVVAAGVWLGPGLVLGPEVSLLQVERRDFVQSVVASGRVEAPHRVDIGAQITGTVKAVPVAEGQAVEAGQTLVELDSAELQSALRQAELTVTQAQARLRQLREVQLPVAEQALRQAQINLDNAATQLQRQQDLFNQGFIGQAALDDASRVLALADAQWRSAREQRAALMPGGSSLALAEAELAQGRANVETAAARLSYARIVAPVAGTLIRRDVERGDVVQAGKVLMVLSPAGETQLIVQIDERNLALLALGQPAQASADAFAQQRFAARLVYINPAVDAQRGSVEVKLAVPTPPDYLKQDMTVSVDIETARRPAAVLVTLDAVRDADTAAPWVLRFDGHRAQRRPVRLGLRSTGFAEVLAGLEPGDLVVPASARDIADGSRLRQQAVPGR
jgi:HlyD family secretion protein